MFLTAKGRDCAKFAQRFACCASGFCIGIGDFLGSPSRCGSHEVRTVGPDRRGGQGDECYVPGKVETHDQATDGLGQGSNTHGQLCPGGVFDQGRF